MISCVWCELQTAESMLLKCISTNDEQNKIKLYNTIIKLDIASRCSVSPDGTWLKCDIQSMTVDTNIPLWGGGPSAYESNLY